MGIYCFRKGMSLAGFVTKTAITALPVDRSEQEPEETGCTTTERFLGIFSRVNLDSP